MLAREHIMKLREERQNLAQKWLKEYSRCAFAVRQQGVGLGTIRAEYMQ